MPGQRSTARSEMWTQDKESLRVRLTGFWYNLFKKNFYAVVPDRELVVPDRELVVPDWELVVPDWELVVPCTNQVKFEPVWV
eukprot:3600282-Rhodomonas_salina.1